MSPHLRRGCIALAFVAGVRPMPLGAEIVGPGAVAAIVRDGAGKPVADALVVADGPTRRSVTTTATGIATLMALPRGAYVLSVTRAGFRTVLQTLTIGAGADTIRNLTLRLAPEDLAGAADGSTIAPATAVADQPYAAAFVATDLDATILADRDARPTVALLGTSPNDSRMELDGIPLPNAPRGGASLQARDALAATAIDVEPSLVVAPLDGPRDAIGGVVDVHTRAIGLAPAGGVQDGYDGRFGSFQHAAYSQTFGRIGVATDDVTGGGAGRSQSVKLAYAASATTSLGFAAYGAQSQTAGDVASATNEPVYAASLHTALGRATFDAREYRSEIAVAALGDPLASSDARVAGTQVALSVPFGENVASFGYDRRRESALADGATATGDYATLDARANLALGRAVRFELGDDLGSGSGARHRNDPHVALSIGTSDRLRVRLAATSAYATAPLSPNVAPETSVGYRASVETRALGTGRVWIAADDIRRRDTFAARTDARSRGVEAGFSRTALPGSLGLLAFARIARATAFGAAQPFARASLAASDVADVPASSARVALEYRSRGEFAFAVGTTVLGPGNALAAGSLVLGDASVAIPFGEAASVRFGIRNAFGHPVAEPFGSAFAPRTITVTFGRR